MSDEKDGFNAAFNTAMEQFGDAEPGEKLEQLALLPLPLDKGSEETEIDARGRGRPKGAKNKRTEAWTEFLLSNYRSPLEALAQIVAKPVVTLSKELNCSRIDAFKLQIQAAKELAPYLHQKQPTAVEMKADGAVNLGIFIGDPSAPQMVQPGDGAVVIQGEIVEEENADKSDG